MKRSASSQSAFPSRSFPGASPQGLPKIQENDALNGVGVDPAEWIAAHPYDDNSYLASWNNYPSANDMPLSAVSACPSLYAGQSVREQPTPLTPQTSSFGYNNVDPQWSYNSIDMANASMSQSSFASQRMSQDMFSSEQDAFVNGRGDVGIDLFACGAGAELPDFEHNGDLPANLDNSLSVPSESASMARSSSNMSTASSKSTASSLERRLKERHQQVLENSRRTMLAPKPQENPQVNATSPAKTTKKGKAVSRKASEQRRNKVRVFCEHCAEHPSGFRGVHELQRHLNSKHSATVNKWVCRDPALQGIDTIRPKIPLDGCKNCESHKQYGAYYNAAAHLRRAHFKPKKEGRGKNRSLLKEEKRGGSAGGHWPSMDVLKAWLEEVVVTGQPVKIEEASDRDQVDNEDDDMDDVDDVTEADADVEIETNTEPDSSPMVMDVSPSTTTGDVSPVQVSVVNDAIADSGYLSLDVSSIPKDPSVLDFGPGLVPTLSIDPTFIGAPPSDWNTMSSGTYMPAYDAYTNQAGIF